MPEDNEMEKLIRSVENMRAQNSAEHGALDGKLTSIAGIVNWIKAKWERFYKHDPH